MSNVSEKLDQELQFAKVFLKKQEDALREALNNMGGSFRGGYSSDQYNYVVRTYESNVEAAKKLVARAELDIVTHQSSRETIEIEYSKAKEIFGKDRTSVTTRKAYVNATLTFINELMKDYKIVAKAKEFGGWSRDDRHLYEKDVQNVDEILKLYAEIAEIAKNY